MGFLSKAAYTAGGGAVGGLLTKKGRQGLSNFFMGTPEKFEEQSLLRKEQEPLYQQLQASAMGEGAGGAFGDSADYYRNLLSDNPEDMQAFAAPEMRRFNEQIIPGISEQFAGMGSGALSSSGFRNAAVGAGTDLSERLGAIRAQLRQRGAEGLQNIGQQGLGQFKENIFRPAQPGLIQQLAPVAAKAAAAYYGGA